MQYIGTMLTVSPVSVTPSPSPPSSCTLLDISTSGIFKFEFSLQVPSMFCPGNVNLNTKMNIQLFAQNHCCLCKTFQGQTQNENKVVSCRN